MQLSIIIVSYKVKQQLEDNLRAIFASADAPEFEVIVVDNASSDGTIEMVREKFPTVRLIANPDNRGFAAAVNQGLGVAAADLCLLLNPDMRVRKDTLRKMIGWAEAHPEAAIASCRLVDQDGKTIRHVRRFPTLADQLAVVLKLPHLFPRILDRYIAADFDYARAASVDSVRGSFFLINRPAMKDLGLEPKLDERYFIWFEEVDLCRHVRAAGGSVWYTPDAECVDLIGQSFRQIGLVRKQGYMRDSMLKYFRKWHPAWQAAVLRVAWTIIMIFARLLGIIKRKK